jgi:hypothetical protein
MMNAIHGGFMSAAKPTAGTLAGLSNDLADAVDAVSRSVVAIHGRRRIPSSGVAWGPGTIVTANHTVTRDEHRRGHSCRPRSDHRHSGAPIRRQIAGSGSGG